MGVLHVEHRIVAGLRHRLVEVELHLRVGLARQHGEAHRVAAHLLQQIAQRDEGPGAFRHAHRLAAAHHVHDLAEHGLERRVAMRHRLHRGLHARHVAAVIGAEHVDQMS